MEQRDRDQRKEEKEAKELPPDQDLRDVNFAPGENEYLKELKEK
ncbi:hypothetical protein [Pseudalkalibacillus caeni]|nr:hypothetical protein [Pseudalkalibacillus caeni]